MKICIVGMGNMGTAIYDSWKSEFDVKGCQREDNMDAKLQNCDAFVLAMKPQNFEEFAQSVKVDLSGKIAISIMTGISVAKMKEVLGCKKVVRTMPNLPLKIGRAVTLWCCDGLDDDEKSLIRKLFLSLGSEIEIEEDSIAKVGAISGCGPAFFAYLAELMTEKAEEFGLAHEDAQRMVKETLIGTALLMDKSGWMPAEMRMRVTSKGGITEAAINSLKENSFGKIFKDGIDAAVKRTKELS